MSFPFPSGPLARFRLYTTLAQYLGLGPSMLRDGLATTELEAWLSERFGTTSALCMPMARVGIYFAIKALIQPGQKVILSPYTIAEVVNMVVCAGGVPVFADIERTTCNIDRAEVERLIDDDTGAVLVTHFYGLTCDVEGIVALCSQRGIPVVEDAAQAFGAKVGDAYAGSIGTVGVFSFGLYKNISSFLGGALISNDDALIARISDEIESLPSQSRRGIFTKAAQGIVTDVATFPPIFRSFTYPIFRYSHLREIKSLNNIVAIDEDPVLRQTMPDNHYCRMSESQAAIILGQRDRLGAHNAWRIKLARIYNAGLADIDGLILPPWRDDGSHLYQQYAVQYDDRDTLLRHIMLKGRDIAASHHKNCADMPCFGDYFRDCPHARAVASSLIYLPTYPGYSEDEALANVRVIRNFFDRQN